MYNRNLDKKNKVLFCASLESEFQKSMFDALDKIGWNVDLFNWKEFISGGILKNFQSTYLTGPKINKINKLLISKCEIIRPDVVFIYKGVYLFPATIKNLKRFTKIIISYNPDNPFGQFNFSYAKKYKIKRSIVLNYLIAIKKYFYYKILWNYYIKTIPLYDINFVPRKNQIIDYKKIGASDVHLLKWHFNPDLHRPIELTEEEIKKYGADVVLIGRYEPDIRTECLESLIDANIDVRLFGTGWNHYLTKKLVKAFGENIRPIYGEDYVRTINASKIVLNFHAKLNNDTSTIRCVEVPACGSLLLSERSEEMLELFEEDKEAVYFSNCKELVEKVKFLLSNPDKIKEIASAGHKRCFRDGHDVYSRMQEWNDIVCEKLKNNS